MDLDKLLKLGPWPKGINNRTDETTVPPDQLRAATNVDITAAGNPRTRMGTTKVLSGVGAHSSFAKPGFPFGLYVTNNTLTAFDSNFNTTAIRSGLKPAQPLSYAEVNNTVFWSNGYDNGRVDYTLTDLPFGLAGPQGTPTLVATTGDLADATYQVACTFLTTAGEESGSTLATVISITTGGIMIEDIPQPVDARVQIIRIYVTPPNGDVLYWWDDVPRGTTSVTLAILGIAGDEGKLLNQWLTPLPPGQIVRYFNGRIWVASGNTVWYSVPWHMGLTRVQKNFLMYPDVVTLLEPSGTADEGGMFIGCGKRTFFLPASTDKEKPYAKQMIAHPFGVVPGTGLSVPGWWFDPNLKAECAFWMDSDGIPVLGNMQGGIRALTNDDKGTYYVGPMAESGSSLIRDINGIRQIIVNLRGTATNTAAATDQLVATVHRNGISI